MAIQQLGSRRRSACSAHTRILLKPVGVVNDALMQQRQGVDEGFGRVDHSHKGP